MQEDPDNNGNVAVRRWWTRVGGSGERGHDDETSIKAPQTRVARDTAHKQDNQQEN